MEVLHHDLVDVNGRSADAGDRLAAALEYRRLGWSPTCCCPADHAGMSAKHVASCRNPGKRPVGLWKSLQIAPASEAQIRRWWARDPGANVGVALGPSSGLVGVDADGPEGEEELRRLSGGDLPPTLQFSTGKGRRLLYAIPPGVELRTTHFAEGARRPLTLMARGAQTVMPPSMHPTGRYYAWEPGRSPREIAAAPAPPWLVEALRKGGGPRAAARAAKDKVGQERRAAPRSGAGDGGRREPEPAESILKKALAKLGLTGNRHNETVALAAQLRDNLVAPADAEALVRRFSAHFPSKDGPPYGEAEALADTRDTYARYPAREPSGKRRRAESAPPAVPGLPKPPPASRCPRVVTMAFSAATGGGGDPEMRVMRFACDRRTCDVCARRLAHADARRLLGRLSAAADAGQTLAAADASAVKPGTLGKRLAGAAGYGTIKGPAGALCVCALPGGARLPKGFAAVAPQDAEARVVAALRDVAEAPPAPCGKGKRFRPVNLSRSWSRRPENSELTHIQCSPPAPNAPAPAPSGLRVNSEVSAEGQAPPPPQPAGGAGKKKPPSRWGPGQAVRAASLERVAAVLADLGLSPQRVETPAAPRPGNLVWLVDLGPVPLALQDEIVRRLKAPAPPGVRPAEGGAGR